MSSTAFFTVVLLIDIGLSGGNTVALLRSVHPLRRSETLGIVVLSWIWIPLILSVTATASQDNSEHDKYLGNPLLWLALVTPPLGTLLFWVLRWLGYRAESQALSEAPGRHGRVAGTPGSQDR